MENKLNPLQIFQIKGIADKFLPVDYGCKDILFWRVPELLEKNDTNQPAYQVTPGENGNKHEFWQKRSDAEKEYIKQSMLDYIDEKAKKDELANTDPRHRNFYAKIYRLLENSSIGRVGSHLAGLYVDCSKIPALFDKPFDEAERIVDNNLVLANVACIYSAFAENHDTENCKTAKEVYQMTVNAIKNPNVHLKPVFCIATKQDGEIVERTYVEERPDLKLSKNQAKLTLQADLINQFNDVTNGKRQQLRPGEMLWIQQISIRNAENEQKKNTKARSFGEA